MQLGTNERQYFSRLLDVISATFLLVLLGACEPSAEKQKEAKERKRIECLDRLCQGDLLPKVADDQSLMKLGGQFFVVPRIYGGTNGVLGFYWPSGTPKNSHDRDRTAPEFNSTASERPSNYQEVGIDIYLRTTNVSSPSQRRGYQFIEIAQSNDWIASRRLLRPGLEAIEMKHVIGPDGYYIDNVTYYIATDLREFDGRPPVAACNHNDPRNFGGASFIWIYGIWVGISMNQEQCAHWPEIFLKISEVLQLVQKVTP